MYPLYVKGSMQELANPPLPNMLIASSYLSNRDQVSSESELLYSYLFQ